MSYLYKGIQIIEIVIVEDASPVSASSDTVTSFTSHSSASPGRLRQLMSLSRENEFFCLSASAVFFKIWHLSCVGRLVPQHPHMMEHLRKGQPPPRIVSAFGVVDTAESGHAPVTHAVTLQLVIGHDRPELGDVKGCQLGTAEDQDQLGRFVICSTIFPSPSLPQAQ